MDAQEFVKYLATHKGEAIVGNPETLAVAQYMEGKGLISKIGVKKGNPIYGLTPTGKLFITQALKTMGLTKGEKAKSIIKTIGGLFQDYAEGYREMHPVGMEDVRRTFGGSPGVGPSSDPIILPPIEPMRLDVGEVKALPKTGKPEKLIKIDGEFYRKTSKNTYEKVGS